VCCGGLIDAAPGWRGLIGGRVCSEDPDGHAGPLWTVCWWLAEVGVGLVVRVVVAGCGGAVAGSGAVSRGQNRMVAGPSWRVLAAWPGFLTG
jgi:hypothetical protein